jgi:hypothetical protein
MFMVFGYIAVNISTYFDERNSVSYKFKIAIFLVYEGIFFVIFVMNYLKGMYLSYSPEFERKALIYNKNEPG